MTGHYSLDELSDWTSDGSEVSALRDPRDADIAAHVEQCPDCAAEVAALREVSGLLGAEPVPAMPADVFGRLSGVVAAESVRRTAAAHRRSGHVAHLMREPRPSLGSFDSRVGEPRRGRLLGRVLVGLGVAAVVGFGGYVLSATAGLNEPVATSPVSINPETLSKQATALRAATDPSPHRFSNAWQCARKVTEGRITGIRQVSVDGEPAYLVYLARSGGTRVSVVRGCGTGNPVVGPSVEIPDR